MCRKLTYLVFSVLVLSMAGSASGGLVAHWTLDEGSGTTVYDSAGDNHHGALNGDPKWSVGPAGGVLEFDGDDHVDIPSGVTELGAADFTIAAWIKTSETGMAILSKSNGDTGWASMEKQIYIADSATSEGDNDGTVEYVGWGCEWIRGSIRVDDDQWHHVAVTWNMDADSGHVYVDGAEGTYAVNFNGGADNAGDTIRIGFSPGEHSADFIGQIDDVRIYDHVLSEIEVLSAMQGEVWPYAWGSDPADGALHTDTWVTLSWKPGGYAVSHDVYLGDNFDDVNDGGGDTFRGNQDTLFYVAGFPGYAYPDGLVPGTTYYWRIDEVNEAEPNSPWKGDIWSFLIPPKTAYYPDPADSAEFVDLNVQLTWTAGFNAKLHYIVFGEDFDEVSNAAMGVPSGPARYSPGPLKLAKTYYWRVDEFDSVETHKGEVWSFTTLGAVSGPNPADGAENVKPSVILRWDAGAVAASHEVYFGTDADAVANATTTSSEYKGPKALGEESSDPGKLTLNTAYYWRIDEVNGVNPDSPWAGNVWSFTTGDFFVIDDFEDYDANDNQIWYSWHDGLGYGSPGTADYYAGNGTGSAVGDETGWSSMEQFIVHGGQQSVPFFYDNNKQGYAKYSEGEHTLTDQRDWTEEGVTELSLWFIGYSGSVGSFVEGPVGTYTMTGSGADIWNVNGVEADEFHFAYKMLTGAGSIVARVDSVENTNAWAKAGVMIRETLDPDSAHGFACVTPGNGVAAQGRPSTGAASFNTAQGSITTPYWVKLERSISGLFTVSHSANGSNWQPVTAATPQNISMSANVYIGLAVTSHDAALICQAVFSNVTTTGTVGTQWANQDIGIASNDAEPLYVAVSNSAGTPAVVVHNDPAAATIDTWTQWIIPLQAFADQGINLSNVDEIAIGLGTKGNMTVPGGSGKMFFDDIRLNKPREAADE